ncbi:MAG: ABC transporter permease [Acidimicrobiales bacterium]
MLLMVAIGFLVGFRIHTNIALLVAAVGMMISFGFSLSWLFAFIGMSVANAESAQAASFPILLPLTFASSAFVPLATMPGWLQAFARNQPVTRAVDAARALVLGGPTLRPVLWALGWSIVLVAAFAPLAVRRYRAVR